MPRGPLTALISTSSSSCAESYAYLCTYINVHGMDVTKLRQLTHNTGETSNVSIELYIQCSTWNTWPLPHNVPHGTHAQVPRFTIRHMFHVEHSRRLPSTEVGFYRSLSTTAKRLTKNRRKIAGGVKDSNDLERFLFRVVNNQVA